MSSEGKRPDRKKIRKAKLEKVVKTIRLDIDVLKWLESEAEKQGMGYQTYLNWYLRKAMTSQDTIELRLERLEQAVFRGTLQSI